MREPAIDGKAQDKEKKSQMAVAGLYRRVLPSPPAIEFASSEGKQLFSEALQGGTMEGFFRLVSYFQTQSEPAYCGLASLSVVLNALSIDPGRKWKGPWRWFDETMLDCCEPLEKIKAEGTTFGKVACLAHCSGAKVNTFRASESNVDEFRKHVIKCASSEDCHLIASYHRKTFKQTGTGHFSPIGGYHAARDMALILDVARFKYPPHWVPVTLLWEAINTIDETTGLTRGFLLVSKLQSTSSLLYTLSCRHENWLDTAKFLIYDVRELLKSDELHTVHDVLLAIFSSLPANANEFIKWVAEVRRREEDGCQLSNEEKGRLAAKEELLQKVRDTTLFKFVIEVLTSLPCSVIPESHNRDTLPEIAAGVCCQGAELLFKSVGSFCCSATCVKSLKCGEEIPKTVVSSTVRSNGTEQGVDMLVPVSLERSDSGYNSCIRSFVKNYPGSIDVFTVLLLALPTNTWCGIKEEKLRDDICKLVSTGTLPHILQEEVLHLRGQLHFLGNCREN